MKRTTSGKQQKKEMQKVYKSEVVLKHHDELSNIIDNAVNTTQHHDIFGDSYTWSYGKYNIFGFTSATKVFYALFCEVNEIVYDYNGTNEPLWMQSWLNYHEKDGLLDWHGHQWPIHGYISIRPHNTKTIFRNPDYDHSFFIRKLKYQTTKLVDCTNAKGYLTLIEIIYNFNKNTTKKPLFRE